MRWLLRAGAALVLLALLAAGALFLLPAERIAALVTQEVSARTGRDFFILGKVRPVFFPVLGVRVGEIRFGNAEWSRSETMLSAESLVVGVELMPLLGGEIRIRDFRLQEPVLLLERNAEGIGNWELPALAGAAGDAGGGSAALPAFSLADGRISGARITYRDPALGPALRIEGLDLALALDEAAGPIRIEGRLALAGEAIDFRLGIASFQDFLQGRTRDVSLALESGFASLAASGSAALSPPSARLMLEARISDLARALALAGQDLPPAAGRAGLAGELTLSAEGALFLRDGRLDLDDQGLAVDLDLDFARSPRPKLTARLRGGALDLSGFTAAAEAEAPAPAPADAASSWPETALDFSALKLLDADVALAAESIDLGLARLDQTRIRAQLERGRLVVGLREVAAYGGRIEGEFVINARGGLSMGGDLNARDLQLLALLNDLAGYDRLDAAASGRLKFLASGASPGALMRSLSGRGRLDVGAGEMIGLDLVGMLRNLDASYRGEGSKTIFESVSGSFTIADGVLTNEDLRFESPLVRADGRGEVDLGARSLAYRLTPTAFTGGAADPGAGISVPVLITGPWSALKFRPDLEGLFDAELEARRAEAEAKIRADLERAAREAEQKLRDDAERALREGVEKGLGDALRRALGQQ